MGNRVQGNFVTSNAKLSLRPIADAGDLDYFIVEGDFGGHHEILRKRAGLIAADHGGAPEGFDRRQVFHERVALGHALHAHRQRQRHGGEQALGHIGDEKSDEKDKGFEKSQPGDEPAQEQKAQSQTAR